MEYSVTREEINKASILRRHSSFPLFIRLFWYHIKFRKTTTCPILLISFSFPPFPSPLHTWRARNDAKMKEANWPWETHGHCSAYPEVPPSFSGFILLSSHQDSVCWKCLCPRALHVSNLYPKQGPLRAGPQQDKSRY